MAKKSSVSLSNTGTLIQIVLGVFFITLGILEMTAYNSGGSEVLRSVSKAFGGKSDILSLVFAILELVAGIVILGSVFIPLQQRFVFIITFALLIVWAIKIILSLFMNDFLEPGFFVWINVLALDLLILVSIWTVNRSS